MNLAEFIEGRRDQHLAELCEFLKIPSDKWVENMIKSGKFKANDNGKANKNGSINSEETNDIANLNRDGVFSAS